MAAAIVDGILQIIQSLGVEHALGQLGVVREADAAQVVGAHHTLCGAERITRCHKGDAGIQAFCEDLADAVTAAGCGSLVGIRQIIDGLVQVAENLLEDDLAAALGQIGGLGSDGLETGRNIAPGLAEVVVDHSAQGQGLAQQVSHIGIRFYIAVFAQTFNCEVGTLYGCVHKGIAALGFIKLSVGRKAVVYADVALALVSAGVIGVVPLYIGVVSVPGKETVTIGFINAESLGNTKDCTFCQVIVGKDCLGVVGRGTLRFKQIVAGRCQGRDYCDAEYKLYKLFHLLVHLESEVHASYEADALGISTVVHAGCQRGLAAGIHLGVVSGILGQAP